MHESKADDVEYSPTPHSAHRLAPVLEPVLVIDPASQVVHDATFDPLEYVPAVHAMHELAPASVPVLVRDPAKQTGQSVEALVAVYLPMGQPEQGSKSKVGLNFPAGQLVHVSSP